MLDYFCLCVCFMQQLSISSVAPAEENDTQLCIVNSLEVRSDEICAESVLSADDTSPLSQSANGDTVDRNRRPHTVISKPHNAITVANNTGVQHWLRRSSRCSDGSSYRKSSETVISTVAHRLHPNVQSICCHSAAETDVHCPVQNKVCSLESLDNKCNSFPLTHSDNMELSEQVLMFFLVKFCYNTCKII